MNAYLPAMPTIVAIFLMSLCFSCTSAPERADATPPRIKSVLTFERSLTDSLFVGAVFECLVGEAEYDSGEIVSAVEHMVFDRSGHILTSCTLDRFVGGIDVGAYVHLTKRFFRYGDKRPSQFEKGLVRIEEFEGLAEHATVPERSRFEFGTNPVLNSVRTISYREPQGDTDAIRITYSRNGAEQEEVRFLYDKYGEEVRRAHAVSTPFGLFHDTVVLRYQSRNDRTIRRPSSIDSGRYERYFIYS